jgi:membrane peptidoglycan carboxypeptidase
MSMHYPKKTARRGSFFIPQLAHGNISWWNDKTENRQGFGDLLGKLRWIAVPRMLHWIILISLLATTIVVELKTAALQSRLLVVYSRYLTYTIDAGPSPQIEFPQKGPFNIRWGYTLIPQMEKRLAREGYIVSEQAHHSDSLVKLERFGVTPPFRTTPNPGLVIISSEGRKLFDARQTLDNFASYQEIPPLIVESLLFIENRELTSEPSAFSSNPVIEWDRLAKSGLFYIGHQLGLPLKVEGGSTLATQLEKYRYSPEGRTSSAIEKARQMLGASLKVYQTGTDTRAARQVIVLDYLNTIPLAALPGMGEINGVGAGLRAWFGADLTDRCRSLRSPHLSAKKVESYKQVLTLLAAGRAPTFYLIKNRTALENRVNNFVSLMTSAGILSSEFARQVREFQPSFSQRISPSGYNFTTENKLLSSMRVDLSKLIGMPNLYDLDRLDLRVQSTLDDGLQEATFRLFNKLHNPEYLESHGLKGERLLSSGDPGNVVYSFLLFEKTRNGNVLRAQADTFPGPLDMSESIKMELGSTAKLRTLTHYLEIIDSLFRDQAIHSQRSHLPQDPLTTWVASVIRENPGIAESDLLERALDRKYSANPGEVFFTGGGIQTFVNFDRKDNDTFPTLRKAFQHSINLVFIRLMRDLVRYHEARLDYAPENVLAHPDLPQRRKLLGEISDQESRQILWYSYKDYQGLTLDATIDKLLSLKKQDPRHLAILFFAWTHISGQKEEAADRLAEWLAARGCNVPLSEINKLVKVYGNPRLNMLDYGYLLNRHPLDVWTVGQLCLTPGISWEELLAKSPAERLAASSWLFLPRNRRAQDLRLRIRFEQDAFARMTLYWRNLGFPFPNLVNSLATAIGSSGDRPAALAELMGIIVNDGMLNPMICFSELRYAQNTPYHTILKPGSTDGTRVLPAPVAHALRQVLAGVVTEGTALRLSGAFLGPEGRPISVGGKTGSGDNRYKTFGRGGNLVASRAVNRTATFVFFIGDRYFGAITASVLGSQAEDYQFTSALPVMLLKLLAPILNTRLTI